MLLKHLTTHYKQFTKRERIFVETFYTMSNYSEVKKPSLTPSKLLFGGGDGNYNASGKKKFHRQHIPMPSCRRFATHWEAK